MIYIRKSAWWRMWVVFEDDGNDCFHLTYESARLDAVNRIRARLDAVNRIRALQ